MGLRAVPKSRFYRVGIWGETNAFTRPSKNCLSSSNACTSLL